MWPQELPGRTGAPPVLSLPVARCSMPSKCHFVPASQILLQQGGQRCPLRTAFRRALSQLVKTSPAD